MRSFRALAIWVLSVLVVSPCAPAQTREGSDQQQLVAMEKRWLGGLSNPAVLQEILAPDFVHVLPNGTITKDEQIAWVKAHPAPSGVSRRFEDLKVRVYGNTAIANGTVIATGPGGERKSYFTDVFLRRNGRWQAVNAQENPAAAP